jgi:hypothetical protein
VGARHAGSEADPKGAATWDDVKTTAQSVTRSQLNASAADLGRLADALRKAGGEIRSGDQSIVARLSCYAADGLKNLSESLKDRGPGRVVSDMESFARDQPLAFFGASVFLGYFALRALKGAPLVERRVSAGAADRKPYPAERDRRRLH